MQAIRQRYWWMNLWPVIVYVITLYAVYYIFYYTAIICIGTGTVSEQVQIARDISTGNEFYPNILFYGAVNFLASISQTSLENVFVFSLPALLVLTAILSYAIFKSKRGGRLDSLERLLMVTIAISVAPLYIPFFNEYIYLGQGSPNVLHNATVVCLRPFAIGAFFLFGSILESNAKNQKIPLIVTGLVLTIGALIKPTFVIVFVPALVIYFAIVHPRFKPQYGRIALLILPCILAIAVMDYFTRFGGIGRFSGRTITVVPFTVWAKYTQSIPVSLLMALAFPLVVLILNFRKLRKDPLFTIAWLMLLVGVLQAGLLAERTKEGVLLYSHNWIGGYLVALTILFYVSISHFFARDKEDEIQGSGDWFQNPRNMLQITALVFLVGHLIAGGIYIWRILQNGTIPYV